MLWKYEVGDKDDNDNDNEEKTQIFLEEDRISKEEVDKLKLHCMSQNNKYFLFISEEDSNPDQKHQQFKNGNESPNV